MLTWRATSGRSVLPAGRCPACGERGEVQPVGRLRAWLSNCAQMLWLSVVAGFSFCQPGFGCALSGFAAIQVLPVRLPT